MEELKLILSALHDVGVAAKPVVILWMCLNYLQAPLIWAMILGSAIYGWRFVVNRMVVCSVAEDQVKSICKMYNQFNPRYKKHPYSWRDWTKDEVMLFIKEELEKKYESADESATR